MPYNGKDAHTSSRVPNVDSIATSKHTQHMDGENKRERERVRARWKKNGRWRKRNAHFAKYFTCVCETDERNGTKRSEQCEWISERWSGSDSRQKYDTTNGFCYSTQTHIRLSSITDNRTLKWKCAFAVCNTHTKTEIRPVRLLACSVVRPLAIIRCRCVCRHNKFHWTDWEWTNEQALDTRTCTPQNSAHTRKDNSIQSNATQINT